MSAPLEYLFVYGTLRADVAHPMARVLGNHAKRVGRAYFRGRLFDLGKYPGAIPSASPTDRVVGELHRLEPGREAPLLEELDRYEGWDPIRPRTSEFMRVRAEVDSETGDRIEAWIYIYNLPTERLERIASGDYRAHNAA